VIDVFFNGVTLKECHSDIHRNIASLRETENLFDDLTDAPQGWQAATELEILTKPHTYLSNQPIIDRPFEEADYCEAITYPFDNWSASRYSDGSYGVWYGAKTLETTIYETAYHWRHGLLKDVGWENIDDVVIQRKVYFVRCDSSLLNFIPKLDLFPELINPNSYHFTQQIGARIHHEGHPGLLSQSARCEGNVYAIFNKQILSNPRQQCYLSYRIDAENIVIERQPNEIILTIKS